MTEVRTPSTWVGVDVSKKKVDVYVERPDGRGKSKVLPNDAEGFAALLAWGRAQGVDWTQTGVCLEATGPYGKPLACALHEAGWWWPSRTRPAFRPSPACSGHG